MKRILTLIVLIISCLVLCNQSARADEKYLYIMGTEMDYTHAWKAYFPSSDTRYQNGEISWDPTTTTLTLSHVKLESDNGKASIKFAIVYNCNSKFTIKVKGYCAIMNEGEEGIMGVHGDQLVIEGDEDASLDIVSRKSGIITYNNYSDYMPLTIQGGIQVRCLPRTYGGGIIAKSVTIDGSTYSGYGSGSITYNATHQWDFTAIWTEEADGLYLKNDVELQTEGVEWSTSLHGFHKPGLNILTTATIKLAPPAKYKIIVNNVHVTAKNASNVLGDSRKSVVYMPDSHRLVLTNAKLTSLYCGESKLFVDLHGDNTISSDYPITDYMICFYNCSAEIFSTDEKRGTLTGTGPYLTGISIPYSDLKILNCAVSVQGRSSAIYGLNFFTNNADVTLEKLANPGSISTGVARVNSFQLGASAYYEDPWDIELVKGQDGFNYVYERGVGPAEKLVIKAGKRPDIYDIVVTDSVVVTELNAKDILGNGHVSYDVSTNTLTLKDAYIKSGILGIGAIGTRQLTINLEGNNTIEAMTGITMSNCGQARITGSGSLNIEGLMGIIADTTDLEIKNSNIKIYASASSLQSNNPTNKLSIINSTLELYTSGSMFAAIEGFKDIEFSGCYIESPQDAIYNTTNYQLVNSKSAPVDTVYIGANGYDVQITASEGGKVDGNISGRVTKGEMILFWAEVTDPCYKFVEWSDGVTDMSRVITITDHVALQAIFSNVFCITSSGEHCMITGSEYYECGEEATVLCEPYSGYKFVNWTCNGVEVSTENPYTFTVSEDLNLVANTEKIESSIENVNSNNTDTRKIVKDGQIYIIRNGVIYDILGNIK